MYDVYTSVVAENYSGNGIFYYGNKFKNAYPLQRNDPA